MAYIMLSWWSMRRDKYAEAAKRKEEDVINRIKHGIDSEDPKIWKAEGIRGKKRKVAQEKKRMAVMDDDEGPTFQGKTVTAILGIVFSSIGILILPFMGFLEAGKYARAGQDLARSCQSVTEFWSTVKHFIAGFFHRDTEGKVTKLHFVTENGTFGAVTTFESKEPCPDPRYWVKAARVKDPDTGNEIWMCVTAFKPDQKRVYVHKKWISALIAGSLDMSEKIVQLYWDPKKKCPVEVMLDHVDAGFVLPDEEIAGGFGVKDVRDAMKQLQADAKLTQDAQTKAFTYPVQKDKGKDKPSKSQLKKQRLEAKRRKNLLEMAVYLQEKQIPVSKMNPSELEAMNFARQEYLKQKEHMGREECWGKEAPVEPKFNPEGLDGDQCSMADVEMEKEQKREKASRLHDLGQAFREKCCGTTNRVISWLWDGWSGKIRLAILLLLLIAIATCSVWLHRLMQRKKKRFVKESDFVIKYENGEDVPETFLQGAFLKSKFVNDQPQRILQLRKNLDDLFKRVAVDVGEHTGVLTKKMPDGKFISRNVTLVANKPGGVQARLYKPESESALRIKQPSQGERSRNALRDLFKLAKIDEQQRYMRRMKKAATIEGGAAPVCLHAPSCILEPNTTHMTPCNLRCLDSHCIHCEACDASGIKLSVPTLSDLVLTKEADLGVAEIETVQNSLDQEPVKVMVKEAFFNMEASLKYSRSVVLEDQAVGSAERYKNAILMPAHFVERAEDIEARYMKFESRAGGSVIVLRPDKGWWSENGFTRIEGMIDTAAIPATKTMTAWPMLPNVTPLLPNRTYKVKVIMRDPLNEQIDSTMTDATITAEGYAEYSWPGHRAGHCGSLVILDNQQLTPVAVHIEGDLNSAACRASAFTPQGIAELEKVSQRARLGGSSLN